MRELACLYSTSYLSSQHLTGTQSYLLPSLSQASESWYQLYSSVVWKLLYSPAHQPAPFALERKPLLSNCPWQIQRLVLALCLTGTGEWLGQSHEPKQQQLLLQILLPLPPCKGYQHKINICPVTRTSPTPSSSNTWNPLGANTEKKLLSGIVLPGTIPYFPSHCTSKISTEPTQKRTTEDSECNI